MSCSSTGWRPLSCLVMTMLSLFALAIPELVAAPYQLSKEAVAVSDALSTLKLKAESRGVEIASGLNKGFYSDAKAFERFRDCRNKYDKAREADAALIDQLIFLSRAQQEFQQADISNIQEYAIEKRHEFFNCKFPGRTETAFDLVVPLDSQSIKHLVTELRTIKADRQMRNVFNAYADRLETHKWTTWKRIEEKARNVMS